MRDVTGKIEDSGATPAGRLSATEHNDVFNDVNDLITRSGQAINSSDTSQSSEATTLAAFRAAAFNVDGTSTANALILVPVSGASGHRIPTALGAGSSPVYNRWDGATINFTPTSNNTGPVTIDIGQTIGTLLGSKKLLSSTGAALVAGDIVSGVRVEVQYDTAADGGTGAWLLVSAAAVQSDWNQASSGQPDYIKNKPGTPTETVAGLPEVATQAETDAGTLDTVMITPLKLKETTLTYQPGDIIQRTTQTSPGGNFLECIGQEISRSTYSDLFAEIGTVHGIGDGSTTFNLPNIKKSYTPLSSNTFASLAEPFTNSITDLTINPNTGDVYACATNEVRKWTKSTGTWSSLSVPAGAWIGIAYNDANDSIYIVSSSGTVYYTAVSPVSWTQIGTAPSITYVGITIDGTSGDLYAFSSSAVYLSMYSTSYATWNLQTTPGSGYTAMGADARTGNIFLGNSSGLIYLRPNGIGSFAETRSPILNSVLGIAINKESGDIYIIGDLSGTRRIYVALGGPGNWNTVKTLGSTANGLDVNYSDGALVYCENNLIARRPGTSISSYIAY